MKRFSLSRGFVFRVVVTLVIVVIVALYIGMPLVMAVAATAPDGGAAGEPPQGFSEVRVPTDDGAELVGWYAEPDNGALILVVHGAGGGRGSTRSYAAMLRERGFGVLALSVRGYDDSTGRINRLGWNGTRDIAAAMQFLQKRESVQAVGGLGLSMGGEILLGAASSFPTLQAIVADGATFRAVNDYIELPMNQPWYRNFTHHIFSFMVGAISGETQPSPTLVKSIADAQTTSFLFIAAGNDDDEGLFNQMFHDAAPDRSSLWIIPQVNHTSGFSSDPAAYEQRVIEFFSAALLDN
ncbi:MAG: alpha/beta fold hydrolase [Anaerolineae bacterium]|nr:alpha/beta fold hydrolase [Anaerolineae bacterium]